MVPKTTSKPPTVFKASFMFRFYSNIGGIHHELSLKAKPESSLHGSKTIRDHSVWKRRFLQYWTRLYQIDGLRIERA